MQNRIDRTTNIRDDELLEMATVVVMRVADDADHATTYRDACYRLLLDRQCGWSILVTWLSSSGHHWCKTRWLPHRRKAQRIPPPASTNLNFPGLAPDKKS